MKKKKMTLDEFIAEHGMTPAAAFLGVSAVTLWRWRKKKTKPEGNDARQMRKLGVTVS